MTDDRMLPNHELSKGDDWQEFDADQAKRIGAWIEDRINSERFRREVRRRVPGFDESEVIGILFDAARTADPSWTDEHADNHGVKSVEMGLLHVGPRSGPRAGSLDAGLEFEGEVVSRHSQISAESAPAKGQGLHPNWTGQGDLRPPLERRTNPWHGQPDHWEPDPITGKPEFHPAAPDLPDLLVETDAKTGRKVFSIPIGLMYRWAEERGEADLTAAEREVIGMRDGQGLSWNKIAERRRPVTTKQNQMAIYRRGKAKLDRL